MATPSASYEDWRASVGMDHKSKHARKSSALTWFLLTEQEIYPRDRKITILRHALQTTLNELEELRDSIQ